MTMQNESAPDLDWLAFQYTIDELSPADAAQFEARLADEQAAREALAQAVLLGQALRRAAECPLPAAAVQRQFAATWIWAACGAAACLAIIAAGQFWTQRRPGPTIANQIQPARDEALAQAWFSARLPLLENDLLASDVSSDLLASDVSTDSLASDMLSDEEIGLAGSDADLRLSVPVWMLEAVQEVPVAAADSERKES
jgi:hypothetical protein